MKKKILSLLLSLCLFAIVFASMPLTASAAESFVLPTTSSSDRMNGNTIISSSTKMNYASWNYRHYPANKLNLGAGTYYIKLYNSNGYLPTSVSGSDVVSGNYVIYSNSGQISSSNTTCKYLSADSTVYNAYFELKLTQTITDLEIYCQNNSTLGQNDVYLVVTKADYSVTLNNQSATTAGSTSAIATYGSAMPSITPPTKTGYSFGGYYTSTGGSGTRYYTASGTSARAYDLTSTTTLYAKWTPNSYTVTFDANGGSGAPASQTKYYGTTLVLSSTKPTRTNYTFLGWSTSSTATSATYSAGGNYTTNAADTLYAVWTINRSTLAINPNGGTWNGYTEYISFTQNHSTTKSIPVPTRTGYNFTGWTRTNTYGSLTSTTAAATYTYGTTNGVTDTLTANWSPYSYTVTFNANGGSGAPASQTKYYGTTLVLSSTKPTRTGYTFLGWSTSSTATSASYSAGGNYTTNAADTLYAVWRANTYTVTLNNQSATTAGSASATATYNSAMPSITPPAKTGHTFNGYYSSANGGGTKYYNADGTSAKTYTLTSGTTLYASWTPESRTITVSASPTAGGSVSGGATVDYGTTVNLSATAKSGYEFTGWYSGATKVSSNSEYSFAATANRTLIAKFEANTYTVTLDNQSATTAGSASATATYNSAMPSITPPAKTGHTFNGYYSSANGGGTKYYNADGTSAKTYTLTSGTTLYASWTPESRTITVSANPTAGGSVSGGATVDYGTTVNLSATAKSGYEFTGWYSGATKVSSNSEYSFAATESIALEARFEINTYTVSLYVGKGATNLKPLTSYTVGVATPLPTASDLSYGSLTFSGWYEDNEFTGTAVTEIPANATGTKTYFAKWTASGVTANSFVSSVDSGYYSPSANAEDEEKEGIIAFSTEFAQIGQYGNQVTDFGIWIYKSGATEAEKVKLFRTDEDSLTELKENVGKFYATLEEIRSEFINNQAFALPYIVIGGQVYFGDALTGTVNLSKWLGEKPLE